jgi:hypothetical protein
VEFVQELSPSETLRHKTSLLTKVSEAALTRFNDTDGIIERKNGVAVIKLGRVPATILKWRMLQKALNVVRAPPATAAVSNASPVLEGPEPTVECTCGNCGAA